MSLKHLQVDDVDEAAAPPSEANERRKWTVSLQTDKFNVLIHLYGNAGVEAFTCRHRSLSLSFLSYNTFLGGFGLAVWRAERREPGRRSGEIKPALFA